MADPFTCNEFMSTAVAASAAPNGLNPTVHKMFCEVNSGNEMRAWLCVAKGAILGNYTQIMSGRHNAQQTKRGNK